MVVIKNIGSLTPINMLSEKISYRKKAEQFLREYYENHHAENIYFSYGFMKRLTKETRQIAKSLDLRNMDYQNAMVATWFRFAGVTDISGDRSEISHQLLTDYFKETNYPENNRLIVEEAITSTFENKYPGTKVQKAVCDAVNSRVAWPNFLEDIILLKEEVNRLEKKERSELFYFSYYRDFFRLKKYYTEYANENYSIQREKNFQLLEKRIHKLEEEERSRDKKQDKLNGGSLTEKGTEDLFKIAFRNCNHLVSVADSKAGLLIRVNSIIISVLLAIVLSKIEKNMFLLLPTIVLLIVCTITIAISILASRPQKTSLSEDKTSHSYQRFFFGSFDLVDSSFHYANWEGYLSQLNDLFANPKEDVYVEIYKESYNVRKVLLKKFRYLSLAYWVFMIGLLFSIFLFAISLFSHLHFAP